MDEIGLRIGRGCEGLGFPLVAACSFSPNEKKRTATRRVRMTGVEHHGAMQPALSEYVSPHRMVRRRSNGDPSSGVILAAKPMVAASACPLLREHHDWYCARQCRRPPGYHGQKW
jgi:hypothetical protein